MACTCQYVLPWAARLLENGCLQPGLASKYVSHAKLVENLLTAFVDRNTERSQVQGDIYRI